MKASGGNSRDNRGLQQESVTHRARLAAFGARVREFSSRPAFREGMREAIPMTIGTGAWGLVAGVAMAKSGMGIPLAIFMSLVTYAGSAQIAALPLIAADAPLWVVWATTLCVSLRFLAFSFHYRPYFTHLPRGQRLAISYLMGDTNFALFIRRFPEFEPGRRYEEYFLGSASISCTMWQVAIIGGIVAGHGIPESWGLGFAGTMALLALTCVQLRNPSSWVAAVVAACAAVAAYALPLKLNILVAIAAAVAFGVMAEHAGTLRKKKARP
jgi:predicted branched-subunit amino acid permease